MGAIVFERYFMVRRQFSWRVIFLGGNCPGGNFPGINHPGGDYPGGNFPLGQLSLEEVFRGAITRGAIIQGAIIRGQLSSRTIVLELSESPVWLGLKIR